ncbi:MAG: hypothetical protein IJ088_13625 [Clostridia bacterium]|nr:hypothetical protein [Clostridia bacterium]
MNTHRLSALLMASCLTLTAGLALADRTLTGDANVDQRNYPSTSPFVHPPFYNLKVTVEVDDNGIITTVRDNGTGKGDSVQDGTEELWENKNRP